MTKPQLANDADLDSLPLPTWGMPKIDGVRGMNATGQLTGRSLDPFKGFGVTERFSRPRHCGLDGELTLGNIPNSTDRLCSKTTGALGRFKDVTEMPDIHWWVFDLITPSSCDLAYAERYNLLANYIEHAYPDECIHLVPYQVCHTRAEVDAFIAWCLEQGYEGAIFRNPRAKAKAGRPGKALQEYVRVKPWADAEILVTGITEGQSNGNAAKTNTLGRTERSSAKAGMVPNGQVGSIQGTMLADFYCPLTKKLLFVEGLEITVGSGEMSVDEATHYFANPDEIVGHAAKFKHMTHGVKDLPRFPTYVSHRLMQDIS